MWDLLNQPYAQRILAVSFLLVLLAVLYYVVVTLRPSTSKYDMSRQALSDDFEELQSKGDIDEEELRKIKSVLSSKSDTPPG